MLAVPLMLVARDAYGVRLGPYARRAGYVGWWRFRVGTKCGFVALRVIGGAASGSFVQHRSIHDSKRTVTHPRDEAHQGEVVTGPL